MIHIKDLLSLICENADMAGIGNVGGLYVSPHTEDPGETGDQTTNECAYTGYARVASTEARASWNATGSKSGGEAA